MYKPNENKAKIYFAIDIIVYHLRSSVCGRPYYDLEPGDFCISLNFMKRDCHNLLLIVKIVRQGNKALIILIT